MRRSTSASQACGSTPFNLSVSINVSIAAARSPPRSEPANNHARRPRAIPRNARSAALLVRQIRPSSRNRVKEGQRFSTSLRRTIIPVSTSLKDFRPHHEPRRQQDHKDNDKDEEKHLSDSGSGG